MLLKDYRTKQAEIDRRHEGKTNDELERLYWRSLAFSPRLSGAEIKLSLMNVKNPWNLNKIASLLNYGLKNRITSVNESPTSKWILGKPFSPGTRKTWTCAA